MEDRERKEGRGNVAQQSPDRVVVSACGVWDFIMDLSRCRI